MAAVAAVAAVAATGVTVEGPVRVPYRELCRLLREYLIKNELVEADGQIKCDPRLKALTGEETTTFFELLRCFRSIVD